MEQTFVKFLGAFEGNLKLEVAQERRRIFANGHIIDVYFSHSFTMKRHINSLFTFLKSEVQKTTKIRKVRYDFHNHDIVLRNGGKILIWRETNIKLRMLSYLSCLAFRIQLQSFSV